MIGIYMSDVRGLVYDDNRLLPLMSRYRLDKLKKTSNENARRLSVGAELLLCYAVKKLYCDIALPLDIKGSPKPYIDGINFSISHSKEFAACAVSSNNIGLDIEKINPAQNLEAGRKFLTPDEQKLLTGDNFFDFWTKKESYLKLYGLSSFSEVAKINVLNSNTYFKTFTEHGYKITTASETPDAAFVDNLNIGKVTEFVLNR